MLNRSSVLRDVGAISTAAFDATDFKLLDKFFDALPSRVDHVLVTGPGPYYAPLADFDFERARQDVESHLMLPIRIARNARSKSDRAERFFLWVAQAAARVIARRDSENRRSPFGPRQTADFYDARNSSDCDELTA
jgi:hypothetical protein